MGGEGVACMRLAQDKDDRRAALKLVACEISGFRHGVNVGSIKFWEFADYLTNYQLTSVSAPWSYSPSPPHRGKFPAAPMDCILEEKQDCKQCNA